ncbi:MAG TPA: tetratricopeptide repeat protein [Myxococcota bacterium]|nr:tetratricopeptide repeat protein [Myxococcota bacterium]
MSRRWFLLPWVLGAWAMLPLRAQQYYSHLGERGSRIYYENHLASERQRERADQQQRLEDARSRRGLNRPGDVDPTAPIGLLAGTLAQLSSRLMARAPEPQLTVDQRLERIRTKANKGDVEAQITLAWVYANGYRDRNGFEFPKDSAQAVYWTRKAAESGDLDHQVQMGMRLLYGVGVAVDLEAGARWLQRAADRGHAESQYLLSIMCEAGKGMPKDEKKAMELLRSAATKGSAGAQEAMGEHYYFGESVAKDFRQAQLWFTRAADQGDASAPEFLQTGHVKALRRLLNSSRLSCGSSVTSMICRTWMVMGWRQAGQAICVLTGGNGIQPHF